MSNPTPDAPLPPHSIEAEQQLLGALLTNNDRFDATLGIITKDSFFEALHGRIFEQIANRVDAGQLASPITIRGAFENDQALKEMGGSNYLLRLAGASISSFAVRDYCEVIADLAAKRSLLKSIADSTRRIEDGREGASQIAGDLETSAGAILSRSSIKPLIQTHASALTKAAESINAAYMGSSAPGVSTGLPQLDKKLGFLRSGQMILLAGRPSMGKTTLAQNFAYNAAKAGVGVFFGSLEMMGEELATRFISLGLADQGRSIPYSRMIQGRLSQDEAIAVVIESKRQLDMPMIVGERDVREVKRFRAAARRARQRLADTSTPLGLIVVDYVQKMEATGSRSIYENASHASDMCKDIAMDFGVPVVALAQLSREVERRDPPIPMLADLRETGKLEEDADVALFCYRDAYYLERKLDALDGRDVEQEADLRAHLERCRSNLDIIVAKQRSGPTGTVGAFMDPALCHVTQDRSHISGELI